MTDVGGGEGDGLGPQGLPLGHGGPVGVRLSRLPSVLLWAPSLTASVVGARPQLKETRVQSDQESVSSLNEGGDVSVVLSARRWTTGPGPGDRGLDRTDPGGWGFFGGGCGPR